jgi:predicted O-methyltransferase YrrM
VDEPRVDPSSRPDSDAAVPASNAEFWDAYASARRDQYQKEGAWPGDEWGRPDQWERVFDAMFRRQLPKDIQTAIEIGPGSGKYTLKMLAEYPRLRIIAADVSVAYLDILRERCAELIAADRLYPEKIQYDAKTLHRMAENHGFAPGDLDVMYSIDAMVHVDLQHLVVYWLAARELLRYGGKLIMTVADVTRPLGFYKLIENAERSFRAQDHNIGKFEWMSTEIAQNVLGKLGFSAIEAATSPRDFCFVATKESMPALPSLDEIL